MATDITKKTERSQTEAEIERAPHQGQTALPTDPNEFTFTPEQCRILGQVYQLILGWRKQRLQAAQANGPKVVPVPLVEQEA
jgi:hypothetical protein